MMDREEVPDCNNCKAFDENPEDFVLQMLCPICPWSRELIEPREMARLSHFMILMACGCPIERHELRNIEWRWLAALRNERDRVFAEKAAERNAAGQGADG
jgi:hypothetical protein